MKFVDLNALHQSIESELQSAIDTVIRTSSFIRGTHVEQFEKNYASLYTSKHCISCANGTDALFIALKALGAGLGDEVITTAHSWISTSETITLTGADVRFCDTEEDYFCIDPNKIEPLITSRTRGIIVVHLYGQTVDMDRIMALAQAHGLWVIEDCAQSHLATYKGRLVGTIGDVGTFSFYPGKNLGAMGDAGALITSRDDVADYSTLFARHGGKNNHVMEGINSRMDGLQAAILNVKLNHLEKWTEQRRLCANRYDALLHDVANITTPKVRADSKHVYHLYVIRTKQRDALRAFLKENGIPSIINYPRPLPLYSAYSRFRYTPDDFPVASQHAREILSLPMHPLLRDEEQQEVVEAIESFHNDHPLSMR
ncbi:MAG: DegT/DnrJ/EryC1/StrS family aminotransferase [Magnetococcales bacterium]|nr:DegT/DnrJ/EryC1/StrS family aminotransferase [Magnetococcales bacterium]